ncbi:MAG: hypothetical protein E6J87_23950 [Deltaproteobacteria bacterium]|nr:MAG: hypothetical protein E6J87_23950 [Deltaproteobacteria bacterium]
MLLVGAAVANYGHISAADGMIALVAGGEVRLARTDGSVVVTADPAIAPDPERWGVVQAGTVDAGKGGVSLTAGDAYSLAINHTGITRARDIAIAGGDGGLVQVSGVLDASAPGTGETGGKIAVTGDKLLVGAATLDASGDAGGGEIRVGGGAHGGGTLPTVSRTYVSPDAKLRADALRTGDGGTIIVWSDEATRFYGALSARGGDAGGNGGFAEISGASLDARGSIDLGAASGATGTLLYDPKDVVLHASPPALDGSDAPDTSEFLLSGSSPGQVLFGTPDELLTPFDVYQSELENTNANIVLQATNSIRSPDTFAVRIIDGNSLALETRNNATDGDGTSFTPGIQLANVSFQTGGSGSISLKTGNGSIAVGNLTTHGTDGATGGAGGNVTIDARGAGSSVTVGAIDASGGDGNAGAGGQILVSAGMPADGGSIALGPSGIVSIDASGGDSAASNGGATSTGVTTSAFSGAALGAIRIEAHDDVTARAEITANGGTGGGTSGTSAKGGDIAIASEAGNASLEGSVISQGGASGVAGGTVSVAAAQDVLAAGAANERIQAGTIQVKSGRNVFAGSGPSLVLAAADTGAADTESATVEGKGDIHVRLEDVNRFDRFEVIQDEASGAVDVRRDNGTSIATGTGTATVHTINQLTTENADPHFTYRLADGGDGAVDQIDVATLAVQNVTFGAQGGTIANARADATQIEGEKLLGGIEGVGTVPHVTTSGNLQLFATHIGETTPLSVSSSAESVELDVAGNLFAGIDGSVDRVDLVERSAAGDVTLGLPGLGIAKVVGSVADDTGSSIVESSVITQIDTNGTEFYFHLADDSASSTEATSGEPVLTVKSGAVVTAGADLGLATSGQLKLERGAIDAGGHTVMLVADANRDGKGAIDALATGTGAHVANAGGPRRCARAAPYPRAALRPTGSSRSPAAAAPATSGSRTKRAPSRSRRSTSPSRTRARPRA